MVNALLLGDKSTFNVNDEYNHEPVDELFNLVSDSLIQEIDFSKGRKTGLNYHGVKTDNLTGQTILTDLSYYRQYKNMNRYSNYRFEFFFKMIDRTLYCTKIEIKNRLDRGFLRIFKLKEE